MTGPVAETKLAVDETGCTVTGVGTSGTKTEPVNVTGSAVAGLVALIQLVAGDM